MVKLIQDIIKQHANHSLSKGDSIVADELLFKDNSYEFGEYKTIVDSNFNMETAVRKAGFKELPEKEFFSDHPDEKGFEDNGDALGISNGRSKTFCINPKTIEWKLTVFHELGHLFLNHQPDFFDAMFNPGIEELRRMQAEVEADLFAWFVAEKLKVKGDWTLAANKLDQITSVLNKHEHESGVNIHEARIDEIKKEASRFVSLGRGKNK